MRFKIYKYKVVTSTNDIAINLIKKKRKSSGCVYAEIQTKGRGTHGRKWISEKGNLFSSLFFPLEKKIPPFYHFTIINSIIVSNVIKKFCERKKLTLKFPNDIFLNGKKICGLLQELVTFKNKKFLIIGIGLNVQSNPKILSSYKTTNILLETKKKPEIKEIIKNITLSYEDFFVHLNSYNFESFKKKAETMSIN